MEFAEFGIPYVLRYCCFWQLLAIRKIGYLADIALVLLAVIFGLAQDACRWMGFSWEGTETWQLYMESRMLESFGVRHSQWDIRWRSGDSLQRVCVRSAMLRTTFRCSTPGQRRNP